MPGVSRALRADSEVFRSAARRLPQVREGAGGEARVLAGLSVQGHRLVRDGLLPQRRVGLEERRVSLLDERTGEVREVRHRYFVLLDLDRDSEAGRDEAQQSEIRLTAPVESVTL